MIIKIMYPNNTAEAELGIFPQEFVYEVSSYSLKHVYQRDNPEKFHQILYANDGVLHYMLPPGLELAKPLFEKCTCDAQATSDGHIPVDKEVYAACECNGLVCGLTLLTLYDEAGEVKMMPILLRHCKVFVMNDKGATIDKIFVD